VNPIANQYELDPPVARRGRQCWWGRTRRSSQGEFRNAINTFLQKVHVERFSKQNDKNFDFSFSSTFFCFIAFSIVCQQREFKSTAKKRCTKSVSKSFYKKIGKKQQIQNRLI
jgi:hypothetical protein